jgi:hypothetical protein
MDGVAQGPAPTPRPKSRPTLYSLARLNRHGEVVRVLRMLLANGEIADYDDELANRIHDAIEIVEGVCLLDREGEGVPDEKEQPHPL